MKTYETIEIEPIEGGCAIWLNRPELRNAFSETMMVELTDALAEADAKPEIRVVVLGGRGKAFCAGGDVNWMKKMASIDLAEKQKGARVMAAMLNRLYAMKKPTVARVQGAAFAGGLGLVAACSMAVAAAGAEFAVSEVRLGVIPATISPYVLAAIGERAAQRYFLTAERFSAAEAHRLGLIQEVVPPEDLDRKVTEIVAHLLQGAPRAQGATIALIRSIAHTAITPDIIDDTAARIAAAWASEEAKEGIRSFLEKGTPSWRKRA